MEAERFSSIDSVSEKAYTKDVWTKHYWLLTKLSLIHIFSQPNKSIGVN